ncbi:hypothetical protein NBRC116602_18510 [Hyphomicrobiales bacterium 4NK60-0047b]
MMSSAELTKRLRAKMKSKSTEKRWRSYIQEARPTSKAEVVKLQKRFVKRLQSEARRGLASGLKKKVLEELINERLQISVAKRQNIIISDTVLDGQITRIAQRNNKKDKPEIAKKKFYATLASRGVGSSTFRERIRASLAWQQLVRRKFGRDVSFSDRDVEKKLGLNQEQLQNKKIQLRLVQIILTVASQKDQSQVVKQYVEADAIRNRFSGCSNMKSLVAPYKNATYVNLGRKTLDQLPSPINIILGDMKAGQITPPQPTSKGLEMYAVCERKSVAIDDSKRRKALGEMRQKAFQLRAKRYMSDLRQDAHIEYRN